MRILLVVLICLGVQVYPALAFPVERCVNMSNALEARAEGDWGYRIGDRDLAAIASEGFDTIRLPVRFQAGYLGDRIDPKLLRRVDHVVRTALSLGLNLSLIHI